MTKVHSKATGETIEINRIIGHIKGQQKGPTLIAIGAIHGNEPSGIIALKNILESINPADIHGEVYGIAGNLRALANGDRYNDKDLNRLWSDENIHQSLDANTSLDIRELQELYHTVKELIGQSKGPVFFIDLHTTSSQTMPFLTINKHADTLTFSAQIPVPKVSNIDDFVKGAFFTYMNKLGHVALGFEAGQHDDIVSIHNHESFIYVALKEAGILVNDEIYEHHFDLLSKKTGGLGDTFRIKERFEIKSGKAFQMELGFSNFEKIEKDQLLASYDGQEVRSKEVGNIFLPLYQSQGDDGFFIIELKH